MGKKQKLKAASDAATKPTPQTVYDRTTTDLPLNANVAPVEIESAYGLRDGAAWDGQRGEWVVPSPPTDKVVASLRDDALRDLYVRHAIEDYQYRAGRRYQHDWDMSLIGGTKAIDFTREAVDGGKLAETLTDATRNALGNLEKATRLLGAEGDAIVRAILGEGLTIGQYAARRAMESRSGKEYVGRRFRECLETLAYLYGLTTRRPDTPISCTKTKFRHARG